MLRRAGVLEIDRPSIRSTKMFLDRGCRARRILLQTYFHWVRRDSSSLDEAIRQSLESRLHLITTIRAHLPDDLKDPIRGGLASRPPSRLVRPRCAHRLRQLQLQFSDSEKQAARVC